MAIAKRSTASRRGSRVASTNATAPVSPRPPFILNIDDVAETEFNYPDSKELLSAGRAIGKAAGLLRIGLHLKRVAPGRRTSWPHAESNEEEFAYVIAGELDCWIDGNLHPVRAGDLIAFPAGTGIAHCLLNNGTSDAILLVGGEATKSDNKIAYPLHPHRATHLRWSEWWHEAPLRLRGDHDGMPDALRTSSGTGRTTKPRRPAKPRPQITVVVKAKRKSNGTRKAKS